MDYYLFFKLFVFFLFIIFISFFGLLNSYHMIYIFISVELILTSFVSLLLLISKFYDELNGLLFGLILLGLIACETAMGLIILIKLKKTDFYYY